MVTKESPPYKCPICPAVLPSLPLIKCHTEAHSVIPLRLCRFCLRGFVNETGLEQHIRQHVGSKPFQCLTCQQRLSCRRNLMRHMQTHICPICQKCFKNKLVFNAHPCQLAKLKKVHHRASSSNKLGPETSDCGMQGVNAREYSYSCSYCRASFSRRIELQLHLSTHGIQQSGQSANHIPCSECAETFTEQRDLTTHMKSHSTVQYQCPFCPQYFSHPSELEDHRSKHSGKKPFLCEICSKSYARKSSLKRHFVTHVSSHKFLCLLCCKQFADNVHLSKHQRVHEEAQPCNCNVCGKRFADAELFKYHTLTHHVAKELLTCDICQKMYRGKESLRKHLYTHRCKKVMGASHLMKVASDITVEDHLKRVLPDSATPSLQVGHRCPTCGEVFSLSTHLAQHMACHSTKAQVSITNKAIPASQKCRPQKDSTPSNTCGFQGLAMGRCDYKRGLRAFICLTCMQSFAERSKLKRHIKAVHSGPLTCSICQAGFSQQYLLKKHVASIHSNEDTSVCQTCFKVFASESQLKEHSLLHSASKVFECYCGKLYKNKGSCEKHRAAHRVKDAFRCLLCPKSFTRGNGVKNHMAVHSVQRPYKCITCQKTFPSERFLRRHMVCHKGVQKAFKCDRCEWAFARHSKLHRHLAVHTKGATVKCPFCVKTFGEREVDAKSTPDDVQFKCIICHATFPEQSHYHKHMAIHEVPKPCFQCATCGKTFNHRGHFHRHMTTHTGRYRFNCSLCKEVFAQQTELVQHVRLHMQKKSKKTPTQVGKKRRKSYKCTMCVKAFAHIGFYQRHLRLHSVKSKFVEHVPTLHDTKPVIRESEVSSVQNHQVNGSINANGTQQHTTVPKNRGDFLDTTDGSISQSTGTAVHKGYQDLCYPSVPQRDDNHTIIQEKELASLSDNCEQTPFTMHPPNSPVSVLYKLKACSVALRKLPSNNLSKDMYQKPSEVRASKDARLSQGTQRHSTHHQVAESAIHQKNSHMMKDVTVGQHLTARQLALSLGKCPRTYFKSIASGSVREKTSHVRSNGLTTRSLEHVTGKAPLALPTGKCPRSCFRQPSSRSSAERSLATNATNLDPLLPFPEANPASEFDVSCSLDFDAMLDDAVKDIPVAPLYEHAESLPLKENSSKDDDDDDDDLEELVGPSNFQMICDMLNTVVPSTVDKKKVTSNDMLDPMSTKQEENNAVGTAGGVEVGKILGTIRQAPEILGTIRPPPEVLGTTRQCPEILNTVRPAPELLGITRKKTDILGSKRQTSKILSATKQAPEADVIRPVDLEEESNSSTVSAGRFVDAIVLVPGSNGVAKPLKIKCRLQVLENDQSDIVMPLTGCSDSQCGEAKVLVSGTGTIAKDHGIFHMLKETKRCFSGDEAPLPNERKCPPNILNKDHQSLSEMNSVDPLSPKDSDIVGGSNNADSMSDCLIGLGPLQTGCPNNETGGERCSMVEALQSRHIVVSEVDQSSKFCKVGNFMGKQTRTVNSSTADADIMEGPFCTTERHSVLNGSISRVKPARTSKHNSQSPSELACSSNDDIKSESPIQVRSSGTGFEPELKTTSPVYSTLTPNFVRKSDRNDKCGDSVVASAPYDCQNTVEVIAECQEYVTRNTLEHAGPATCDPTSAVTEVDKDSFSPIEEPLDHEDGNCDGDIELDEIPIGTIKIEGAEYDPAARERTHLPRNLLNNWSQECEITTNPNIVPPQGDDGRKDRVFLNSKLRDFVETIVGYRSAIDGTFEMEQCTRRESSHLLDCSIEFTNVPSSIPRIDSLASITTTKIGKLERNVITQTSEKGEYAAKVNTGLYQMVEGKMIGLLENPDTDPQLDMRNKKFEHLATAAAGVVESNDCVNSLDTISTHKLTYKEKSGVLHCDSPIVSLHQEVMNEMPVSQKLTLAATNKSVQDPNPINECENTVETGGVCQGDVEHEKHVGSIIRLSGLGEKRATNPISNSPKLLDPCKVDKVAAQHDKSVSIHNIAEKDKSINTHTVLDGLVSTAMVVGDKTPQGRSTHSQLKQTSHQICFVPLSPVSVVRCEAVEPTHTIRVRLNPHGSRVSANVANLSASQSDHESLAYKSQARTVVSTSAKVCDEVQYMFTQLTL